MFHEFAVCSTAGRIAHLPSKFLLDEKEKDAHSPLSGWRWEVKRDISEVGNEYICISGPLPNRY